MASEKEAREEPSQDKQPRTFASLSLLDRSKFTLHCNFGTRLEEDGKKDQQRREVYLEIFKMNNRGQKYEPLAQRDDPIILAPLATQYNYNSATPDSVSAPSIISRTSTSTPPPSFHTHSSPGTPRPSHASINPNFIPISHFEPNINDNRPGQWNGAPPSSDTEVGGCGIGSSNDALATIKGLKQRVEWLEESLGRLLLEKERNPSGDTQGHQERNNCCVSFSDISPDLERSLLGGRQNCMVRYSGTRSETRADQRLKLLSFLIVVFLVCTSVTLIVTLGH